MISGSIQCFTWFLTTISSNEDVFSRHPRWGCLDCTSEFCFVCLYLVWIDHIVHVRVFHSLCVVVQSYTNLKREFFTLKSYLLSILWICNFEMHLSHLTAASAKCANLLIRLLYRGGDRKLVHPCFHQNINNIACTAETRGNIIIYGVRPQQKREVS